MLWEIPARMPLIWGKEHRMPPSNAADQLMHFQTVIVAQVRNALINPSGLQGKGEFFTEVVTERRDRRFFEFQVKVKGITSYIRGTYENGGTVELVTSPGGTKTYKVEELEKPLIDQIVGEWVVSINS
jgi:hypothetical protein